MNLTPTIDSVNGTDFKFINLISGQYACLFKADGEIIYICEGEGTGIKIHSPHGFMANDDLDDFKNEMMSAMLWVSENSVMSKELKTLIFG